MHNLSILLQLSYIFKIIWTGINALIFGITFEKYNSSNEYYYLRVLIKVILKHKLFIIYKVIKLHELLHKSHCHTKCQLK